jgi:hypothetical protein
MMPRKISKEIVMSLTIWLPAMFLLGLAALALVVACVPACDKI